MRLTWAKEEVWVSFFSLLSHTKFVTASRLLFFCLLLLICKEMHQDHRNLLAYYNLCIDLLPLWGSQSTLIMFINSPFQPPVQLGEVGVSSYFYREVRLLFSGPWCCPWVWIDLDQPHRQDLGCAPNVGATEVRVLDWLKQAPCAAQSLTTCQGHHMWPRSSTSWSWSHATCATCPGWTSLPVVSVSASPGSGVGREEVPGSIGLIWPRGLAVHPWVTVFRN